MSNLKRYACQTGKLLVGLPIVAFALLGIVTFAVVAGEVMIYLLDNYQLARILLGSVVLIIASGAAFCIGDELFKKYNICQRFK